MPVDIATMRVKRRAVKEIKKNQIEFQSGILDMQIEEEISNATNEIVFLDKDIS